MNELLINPNKTACFTGHRILSKLFSKTKLKKRILELINDNYDTFLVGMAIGFDTEAFKVLLEIKKQTPIRIIACIPCINQEARFNIKQKEEYRNLLASADDQIIISKEYTPTCMNKRNKFMVDYSSAVIAHLTRENGGTANTVAYAIKNQKVVIYV